MTTHPQWLIDAVDRINEQDPMSVEVFAHARETGHAVSRSGVACRDCDWPHQARGR